MMRVRIFELVDVGRPVIQAAVALVSEGPGFCADYGGHTLNEIVIKRGAQTDRSRKRSCIAEVTAVGEMNSP